MKKLNKVCLFSSLLTGIFMGSVALSTHVDAASTVVMYRLYNPSNHEHFYTSSTKERDHLVKIHWGNYEGPAWNAPTNTSKLVYRLYNKGLRDHHYTASWKEVQWLTKNYGWTYEGPAWRSANKNNHPVYRLFLKGVTSGSHHYTGSWKEVQWLTKNYGWKYEGVGWYCSDTASTPKVNKSALQALYTTVKNTKNNNYTSASWKNFQNALTNAKHVLDNAKANQKQVNSAKTQLDSAYKGLKKNPAPTVNKNALQSLYNQVKGITKGDYTDATWNVFQTALNNAKNVLNNTKATQNQVNDAKNKLESAYKGLTHKPKPAPTPQNYTVTVNHVDADTNAVLSTEVKTVYEGDNFSTPWKNMTNQNYYLCSNDDPEVAIDITSKNGTRFINNIRKNKTITFKYKHISLNELKEQLRQKELIWLNNYRQQNGVGTMQFNDIVQKAADIRAQEIQTNFSHYRPGGGTFQDLLESLGCYGGQGENLNGLAGYIDEILGTGASSATDIMETWTEDEGHKGNLLYANQTITGMSTTFELQPSGYFKTKNVFISANPIFK